MKRKIITGLMVLVIIAMNCIPAFAQTNQRIRLSSNQRWDTFGYENRTGDYKEVLAECVTVYPINGADNFKTIQARVRDTTTRVITVDPFTKLTEGKGQKKIEIKNGYLSTPLVQFQFRGNTDAEAYAIVNYYGL